MKRKTLFFNKQSMDNPKIVRIDKVDDSERWVPIPGTKSGHRKPRIKELHKKKGNCYFAVGVSQKLIDFVYRSVMKLKLRDKTLIFSRGTVKRSRKTIFWSVDMVELDWDVGISVIIPRRLSYTKNLRLLIDEEEHFVRMMEIVVLAGLLRISSPDRAGHWYSRMAATVLTKGWKRFDDDLPAEVFIIDE